MGLLIICYWLWWVISPFPTKKNRGKRSNKGFVFYQQKNTNGGDNLLKKLEPPNIGCGWAKRATSNKHEATWWNNRREKWNIHFMNQRKEHLQPKVEAVIWHTTCKYRVQVSAKNEDLYTLLGSRVMLQDFDSETSVLLGQPDLAKV